MCARTEQVMEFEERFAAAARRFLEAKRQADKRQALSQLEAKLEKAATAAFEAQGKALVKRLAKIKHLFPTTEAMRMWAQLDPAVRVLREAVGPEDWGPLWDDAAQEGDEILEKALLEVVKDALAEGARRILGLVGAEVLAAYGISWTLDNPRAVAYLREHGADLVSRIDEATRKDLRALIAKAMEDGRSYDEIAKDIITQFKGYGDPNSYWRWDAARPQRHIESRAHLVAVTEVGNAFEEGEFEAAKRLEAAGLTVVKWWSTIGDERVSAGCEENAGDGEIGIDELHSSGDLHPLRFPGCRCTEMYDVRLPAQDG